MVMSFQSKLLWKLPGFLLNPMNIKFQLLLYVRRKATYPRGERKMIDCEKSDEPKVPGGWCAQMSYREIFKT